MVEEKEVLSPERFKSIHCQVWKRVRNQVSSPYIIAVEDAWKDYSRMG